MITSRHVAWRIGRRIFIWSSPTPLDDPAWVSMYNRGIHFSMCWGD